MKVLLILLGIIVVVGIGAFIFSKEKSAKKRLQDAATTGLGVALAPIMMAVSLLFQAIPIVIAIFIVIFLLRACS